MLKEVYSHYLQPVLIAQRIVGWEMMDSGLVWTEDQIDVIICFLVCALILHSTIS